MIFARLATEADVDAIVEMARLNVEETCPGEPFSERRVRETLDFAFRTALKAVFVAEENRKVIGFLAADVCYYDHRDGFSVTQRVLYVRPERRGTRAAALLMKELIAWSRRIGADAIDGGNDNGFRSERTAAFLRHFGFRQVGYAMRMELTDGRPR